jgi:hypothetical protein
MLQECRSMRAIRVLFVLCALAACDRGNGDVRVDGSQISNSAGEVALTDGGSLQYSITSDRYKQWDTARQGLDRRIAARFGALLQPASPSDRSIARAVEYLEGDPRARQAIERAGMSVRDFVVMTVALEQEMRLASRQDAARDPEPLPAPPPYPPYPIDSSYVPAYPYAAPPAERRVDSLPRVDTVFVQPPRPVSQPFFLPSDTMTPKRDTAAPKRDTVLPRRDTVSSPKPVPRDTARDTARDTTKRDTSRTPVDTISRT